MFPRWLKVLNAWDGSPDCYTTAKVKVLFQKFDEVEDLVIKTRALQLWSWNIK
jgi:hypothetical protein